MRSSILFEETTCKRNRTDHVSPRLLALIPLAIGINLAMGQFAAAAALPLFLDTVGTVLVAVLAGLAPALLTGLISQVVFTVVTGNVTWLAFLPVQLFIGAYAALAADRAAFASVRRTVVSGLGLGVLAAAIAAPIAYFAFGGVTSGGVTVVTAALTGLGVALERAVFASSLINDLLDKTVTFLLVRTILVTLPRRVALRFPGVPRALGLHP